MRCVAVGCRTGRRSGLRIHSFPRDPKRRLEWAVKVNIAENGKLWVPPKDCSYGVCEAHFDEDQYEPRRTDRKLKPFAVPTLFSHRKVPKRRRKLVRSQPTSTSVTTTAAEVITVASTATGRTNAATVPTVMAPKVASSATKTQPSLLRSASNHSSLAGKAQRTQVTPSSVSKLLTPPVNAGPAFTVATSDGNVILVPATTHGKHHYIVGDPPVMMDMRTPSVLAHTVVPNACMPNNTPVLPAVNCLPNAGPIILVPVSKPKMVPVPNPVKSPSSQMPVILSVESLAPNASPPVSKASGMPPLLAKPTSYEKLQEEATALRQQTDELRREVTELSRQAVRVKASLARQSERLSRFLRMDQVECLQKLAGDKPTRWTEPTLRFALDIYRCSPEAYRKLLVAHYPLPMETALRTFCVENGVREGVPAELLQMDMRLEENEEEENGNVDIVWL
ncbi:uncharacterized protein LOC119390143 [Rhipicephalus sanguineus]|nr:uncharacterized protein LOC119390143 [Rhipicephalus sanguineus]